MATGGRSHQPGSRAISAFTAPAIGTYYVVVSCTPAATYNLVVTRDAAFDTPPNNTFATAEDVTGTQGTVGAITPSSTVSNNVVPASATSTETNNGNAYPFDLFGLPSICAISKSTLPRTSAPAV